ncbi:hypothetical protein WN944_003848 [Citrus x changshan-huyou]|uniref:Uncharacterized protein n=1 Tax=Citrus x changshan-huyou TaxID=2935761 RepID=A0AAP0M0C4_9ROSI
MKHGEMSIVLRKMRATGGREKKKYCIIWLHYMVLAPWIIHSTYSSMVKDEKERDLLNFLIFPFLLWRMLHNQIWISLSRYRTANGSNRIVDKSIEFEQVERERNWSLILRRAVHEVLERRKNGEKPIGYELEVAVTHVIH